MGLTTVMNISQTLQMNLRVLGSWHSTTFQKSDLFLPSGAYTVTITDFSCPVVETSSL